MTVATEQSSEVYSSIVDGVPLNVPFPVQATTELKVRYGSSDTLAVQGVHYTVALVPPEYLTATVTPITGFAALSEGTISVRREVPYTQPTDIPTLASLASARLEQMFDRIVFICQQVRDGLAYALRFPTTDTAANIGPLPVAADRAGKYLGFDVNGKPVAATVISTGGDLGVSAFGQQFVLLADETSARTMLDLYTTGEVDAAVAAAEAASVPKNIVDTAGDLIVGTANNMVGRLPFGGVNRRFLKIEGGVLVYEQVDLATSDIEGILPRANGGFTPAQQTAVLEADVTMNSTSSYFDGPELTLGTGLWYVWGYNTVFCAPGALNVSSKLWDGATIIGSAFALTATDGSVGHGTVVTLAGFINNPTGPVKLSCKPGGRTDAKLVYNQSGNEMDCALHAIRIG